jgi:tetratricopeptide (TPR) repeat protein/transglutaminase-like putative cysteine protease
MNRPGRLSKFLALHAFFLVVLTLWLAALGARAAAESHPWDAPEFAGDPKAILQAAQAVPNPKGYDVIVLLDDRHVTLDAQGRMTEVRRFTYRVNTTKGVENWGSIAASWEPWHQERPELKTRVITADGATHLLDPATLVDAPAGGENAQIYSDNRIYKGPMPAVAPGSVVEQVIITREKLPFFEAGMARRRYYGQYVPILQARLVIEAPSSLPLRYAVRLLPRAVTSKTEANGKVTVSIEIGAMEAQRRQEPFLPPDAPMWPHVDFSTGVSWQQIADSYRTLSEAQMQPSALTAFQAETAKDASREEIIRAMLVKLDKEVRYTGIEFSRSQLVPYTTGKILERRFGDCKDKASLLVTMLRARGIEAYMALLVADEDSEDVEAEMPGMGIFNHAIVVVPGKPELWIDATAPVSHVGELPGADQGRLALIIRPGTTGLTRTPESPSTAVTLVETREFYLSEMGKARVVETTEATGDEALSLRNNFGSKVSDEGHKKLEEYMDNAYLAEKLTGAEITDPNDMAHPYNLRLEAAKASRGYTSEQDALAAIPLTSIFGHLPSIFRTAQDEDGNDKKTADGREPTPPRTADLVLPQAFVQEWHYKVVPPPGFQIHGLPENKSLEIGPARLSQHFLSEADGSVSALFRFDSVKRRFTAAEVKQMREIIRKMQAAPMIDIAFDQTGYALLAAGKIRESLAAYRALIKLHPTEGQHRAQLANALTHAGLGEEARAEAREAVKLEPTSAFAFKSLGWVLEHDPIGRMLEPGFDRENAIAAFRKAKELDPKDKSIRIDLAILLEYDNEGERYTSGSSLKEAVQEYRDLKALDKEYTDYDDNLAFALLYDGQFAKLTDYLNEIGLNSVRRKSIAVAAVAAAKDSAAAQQRASEISTSTEDKLSVLYNAGQMLMYMRLYPQAAELMQAGMAGQTSSPQKLGQVEALRTTKRHEELPVPPAPAQAAAQKFMTGIFTCIPAKELVSLESRQSLNDGKSDERHLKDAREMMHSTRASMRDEDIPLSASIDMALSNFRLMDEEKSGNIARITTQINNSSVMHIYVIQEDGQYKILSTSGGSMPEIGREVLDRLATGDTATAKKLLDWARADITLQGGDDPLAGDVFPRFWNKGNRAEKAAMEYAAAALIVDGRDPVKQAIPILQRGLAAASGQSEQTRFLLALAEGYEKQESWKEMKEVALRLTGAEPSSETAFDYAIEALNKLHEWDAAGNLTQDRMSRISDDKASIVAQEETAEMQGNFDKARALVKPMIDSGRATSGDMNGYAWAALYTGKVTGDDIQIAQRALAMENNNSFAIMHTLACLLAASGKTKEARELLLQAMKTANEDEPNTEIWLGFGLIAEQYGEASAARAAYNRMEKPEHEAGPTSSYALRELRLLQMGNAGLNNAAGSTAAPAENAAGKTAGGK